MEPYLVPDRQRLGLKTGVGHWSPCPCRPDASIKKLAGYDDRYRLRVGDYRVLHEVIDGQSVILVVGVGHRRDSEHRPQATAGLKVKTSGRLREPGDSAGEGFEHGGAVEWAEALVVGAGGVF